MQVLENWKTLIIYLLEDKNDFTRVEDLVSVRGNSTSLVFEKNIENSKTKIEVTILEEGELVVLRYTNPMVLGYDKFSFGEYFYSLQFQTPPDYGKPGLEFNKTNIEGIKSILKNGVKGKEIQYFREDIVLKSEVNLTYDDNQVFKFQYDFTERPW